MTPMPINRMTRATRCAWGAMALAMLTPLSLGAAEPAPFEMPGPALDILVMRGDQSLPIAQVPSLSEGDRLSVEADLPTDQGARFIRGRFAADRPMLDLAIMHATRFVGERGANVGGVLGDGCAHFADHRTQCLQPFIEDGGLLP